MSHIQDEQSQEAWDAFARHGNYGRIERVVQRLAPRAGYFACRPHLPMEDGNVCIGYVESESRVRWDQTANMYVMLQKDEVAQIGIHDIRRDKGNKQLQTGLLRYADKIPTTKDVGRPLDGFVASVYPDGHHELMGLRGEADVPLPGITEKDADAFVIACLIALENRAAKI